MVIKILYYKNHIFKQLLIDGSSCFILFVLLNKKLFIIKGSFKNFYNLKDIEKFKVDCIK